MTIISLFQETGLSLSDVEVTQLAGGAEFFLGRGNSRICTLQSNATGVASHSKCCSLRAKGNQGPCCRAWLVPNRGEHCVTGSVWRLFHRKGALLWRQTGWDYFKTHTQIFCRSCLGISNVEVKLRILESRGLTWSTRQGSCLLCCIPLRWNSGTEAANHWASGLWPVSEAPWLDHKCMALFLSLYCVPLCYMSVFVPVHTILMTAAL